MATGAPAQALMGVRGVVGAGAWLTPRLAGRLFGLDPDGNPQSPYLARLFGVRDVALAAGLGSSTGEARALWLRIGVACDLADAAAGMLAGRRGYMDPLPAFLVTTTALVAAGLGVTVLRAEST